MTSKEPLLIAKYISSHPGKVLIFSFSLFGVLFSTFPFMLGYNVFATDSQGNFGSRDSKFTRRADAVSTLQIPEEVYDCSLPWVDQRNRSIIPFDDAVTILLFHAKDNGNLFTPDRLQQIQDVENMYMSLGSELSQYSPYRFEKFCLLDESDLCVPPLSPLTFFYEENTTTLVTDSLEVANRSYGMALSVLGNLFGDYGFSVNNTETATTRTMISWGRPLKTHNPEFCNEQYKPDEQAKLFRDFISKYYTNKLSGYQTDDIEVFFFDFPSFFEEMLALINRDFSLVTISISAIFVVLIIQTQSLFLSLLGAFHIFLSYPAASFIYIVILGNTLSPSMNIMSLFIIMGIGADDVFVVTDAWKQSSHQSKDITKSIAHRMSWTWARASKAMLITSVTTFAAFLSVAYCPIPAISAFGSYAAATVACNYLLVITWYPALIVVWNKYGWEYMSWKDTWNRTLKLCKCKCKDTTTTSESDTKKEENTSTTTEEQNNTVISDGEIKNINDYRFIERYYYKYHAQIVYKTKYYILILFFISLGLGILGAINLEGPPGVMDVDFHPDSIMGKQLRLLTSEVRSDPESGMMQASLDVVFGLTEPFIDRTGIDPNDMTHLGKVVFAENFDISAEVVQSWMYDLCFMPYQRNLIPTEMMFRNSYCYIKNFKEWIEGPDNNATFPVPQEHYITNLTNFMHLHQDLRMFVDYNGLENLGEFRWAFFRFPGVEMMANSDVQRRNRAKWEIFKNEQVDNITNMGYPEASHMTQSNMIWTYLESVEVMESAAWTSVGISMAIAFGALIISTQNILISFYACICITGVVFAVCGLIVVVGWRMNPIIAIIVTILVGISVDFCAHFAHAYQHSNFEKRFERTRQAITNLGISLTGATCTSLLACLPLLFTEFQFFSKFGAVLALTIIMSYVYSHLPFLSILMLIGPEGNQGDLRIMDILNYFLKKDKIPGLTPVELTTKSVETQSTGTGDK